MPVSLQVLTLEPNHLGASIEGDVHYSSLWYDQADGDRTKLLNL